MGGRGVLTAKQIRNFYFQIFYFSNIFFQRAAPGPSAN